MGSGKGNRNRGSTYRLRTGWYAGRTADRRAKRTEARASTQSRALPPVDTIPEEGTVREGGVYRPSSPTSRSLRWRSCAAR